MLGWHFSVYRQQDGGREPAEKGAKEGAFLAAWTTGLDGLDELEALVKTDDVIELQKGGYPSLCKHPTVPI